MFVNIFFNHLEPPVFVKKLSNVTAVSGEEVTLVATVKGSQPMTVSWVQDKDHVLRDGDNRKIAFENNQVTLKVFKADKTTAGKYTCQLKNDAGVAECVANLTVLGLYMYFRQCLFRQCLFFFCSLPGLHVCMVSPLFSEPALIVDRTESFSVTEGEIAALECTVAGTPELTPRWYRNGVELASGKKYQITFAKMISSLKILTSERNDTGEYTFEVKNEVGTDTGKMHLTVLGL